MITSFWIHPHLSKNTNEISKLINTLFSNQISQISYPEPTTLHIAPNEIVIKQFGTKLFFISEDGINSAIKYQISANDLFLRSNQMTSFDLRQYNIQLTGFEQNTKSALIRKMVLLGFDPHNNSDERNKVILVSGKAMTQKIIDSEQNKTFHPILTEQWIESCFQHNGYQSYEKFSMPPFYKLIITSSDLTPKQRNIISKIINQNGGVLSEVFDQSVDCLIALSINRTTKIILALERDIPIIAPLWILQEETNPMPYILNWWCISKETRPLFNNLSFYLDDSLRDKVGLEKAIRAYNGKIFTNIQFQAPYNIFILDDGSPLIENVIGAYSTEVKNQIITNQKVNILSPRWIWACINANMLIDFKSSFEYKPFPFQCPLQCLKGKIIAILGYNDRDRIKISNIIKEFGATAVYSFSKHAYFVITRLNNNLKLTKLCHDNGINMFPETILFEIIRNGELQNINDPILKEKYQYPKSASTQKDLKDSSKAKESESKKAPFRNLCETENYQNRK